MKNCIILATLCCSAQLFSMQREQIGAPPAPAAAVVTPIENLRAIESAGQAVSRKIDDGNTPLLELTGELSEIKSRYELANPGPLNIKLKQRHSSIGEGIGVLYARLLDAYNAQAAAALDQIDQGAVDFLTLTQFSQDARQAYQRLREDIRPESIFANQALVPRLAQLQNRLEQLHAQLA